MTETMNAPPKRSKKETVFAYMRERPGQLMASGTLAEAVGFNQSGTSAILSNAVRDTAEAGGPGVYGYSDGQQGRMYLWFTGEVPHRPESYMDEFELVRTYPKRVVKNRSSKGDRRLGTPSTPELVPEPDPEPESALITFEVYPDHVRISHADAARLLEVMS